ncbi:MAG: LUD domain-containing protein [Planctomycetaceae bacterium]|nr:LUD domain-containing protein [Planctomycetaceae bacterium]
MTSRDEILRNVRRRLPQSAELPSLDRDWIRYPDREAQFLESLAFVGGRGVVVDSVSAADFALRELPAWSNAKQTFSAVPGVGSSTVDLSQTQDPHALQDVDFAVLPGEFAVAENGAVWITDANVRHRVIYFLTQHLALVVPRREMVDTMHAAYERISLGEKRFGAFISGPSKTADIEQSLVIGAHGARSMTVFLVSDGPA